jgi:hypothetical protein
MIEELGFVGNIWVRQNYMEKTGDMLGGHAHTHDHVSLLTSGSVEVTVNNGEPKHFTAPTFIVIRKGLRHKIVALEDKTVWYCVFSMRDIDGDTTEIVDDAHLPSSISTYSPDIYDKFLKWLETENK